MTKFVTFSFKYRTKLSVLNATTERIFTYGLSLFYDKQLLKHTIFKLLVSETKRVQLTIFFG